MSDALVRLESVSMAFRGRVALDAVSLTVRRGEVLALLGPNGAGKSTAFALLLGHLRPQRGDVTIGGVSVAADRRRALAGVGAVLETPAFHDHLTGWENLALLVSYAAEPDPAAMLDAVRFVGLEDRMHDRVRGYSHGMRQRLAIAQALVPAPALVLLDEPADGLDPEGVDAVHELIRRMRGERAVTVVIASHLLAEIETVCDRVAILDRGRLVFDDAFASGGPRSLARVYRDALAAAHRMIPFVRQLGWELRKLWRRPRTYVGFGATLAFELVLLGLLHLPPVQEQFTRSVWRLSQRLQIRDPFSALSNAVEVAGQTMLFVGAIAILTVAADLVAREAEEGTLRMTFCRPVSRTSVLAQKLLACLSYTVALASFVGVTTLLISLVLEKPGQLVVMSARESVLGVHDFGPGLVRYAAALPLLAVSMSTVALLGFALSCLRLRAATVTMVAIMALLGDWIVHTHSTLAAVSPYTLTTRIVSWRQVFNQEIPWLRLERNYGELLLFDLGLLLFAWLAFRRRALTPR